MFLSSFALVLFELALTRVFGVVLFASFAHLALGVAMLGLGLGALVQHVRPAWMPDEGLEQRLGGLALAQGVLSVVAVLAALHLPLTGQDAEGPAHLVERTLVAWSLLNRGAFAALLPVLTLPFAAAGWAFGAAFHRRRERLGRLYALDLAGGGGAALAFIPLLAVVPAPDLVWVSLGACGLAAAGLGRACGGLGGVGLGVAALGLGLAAASAGGDGLLRVREAAGYAEDQVLWSRWTPITRISILEGPRGVFALLDNTSASQIVQDQRELERLTHESNRALVYRLVHPGGRVAVLAASAGPEVAVARHFGHQNVDAIDIAAIPEVVRERFPDLPLNPFLDPRVRPVVADGRSAILHAREPYTIIQMVHANLHSSAGQLSNAWSPSLLETREAFGDYLAKLHPDGILSFGRGAKTPRLAHAAAAALRARGVEQPEQHIALVRGVAHLMLVRPRPWTQAERDALVALLEADFPNQILHLDPRVRTPKRTQELLVDGPPLTDDRPYLESPEEVRALLRGAWMQLRGQADGEVDPAALVYHTLVIQGLGTVLGGVLLMGVASLGRGRAGLRGAQGVGLGLGYVAGLGYGYLAVETALVHALVLFVGHPVYALTTVVFTMMVSSGLGSAVAERVPPERGLWWLRAALGLILVLGFVLGVVAPPLLHTWALGLPLPARVALAGALLVPLGLVMGVPWSLGMRLLRPEAAGLVPWAWAVNGWMSVVASVATVFLARLYGFSVALEVALGAYAVSFVLAGALPGVGRSRSLCNPGAPTA